MAAMTPVELAAIEARWSADGGMGNPRGADDYTDAGCRIFAEHGFRDVPALLAVLRERDNTIARVREVLDDYDGLEREPIPKLSTYTWMHEVRAALDPQETE